MLGFTALYARPEERFAFLEREGAQIMIEQTVDPARTWLTGELTAPYGRGVNFQIGFFPAFPVPVYAFFWGLAMGFGASILARRCASPTS